MASVSIAQLPFWFLYSLPFSLACCLLVPFVLGRQCETNSASAQSPMEVFFARPMGKTGDSTFEEVEDNSNALKYRDAFYQKDEHRWTKRRVPGP
jgi:hypothetical protein